MKIRSGINTYFFLTKRHGNYLISCRSCSILLDKQDIWILHTIRKYLNETDYSWNFCSKACVVAFCLKNNFGTKEVSTDLLFKKKEKV